MRYLIPLALASLCACASGAGLPTPKTPAQTVYEAEGLLTSAIHIATIYKQLPVCAPGPVTLCSDPTTVAAIQASADTAAAAVEAGQTAVQPGSTLSPAAQQQAAAQALQAASELAAMTARIRTQ